VDNLLIQVVVEVPEVVVVLVQTVVNQITMDQVVLDVSSSNIGISDN
jgi:hypothetical protein